MKIVIIGGTGLIGAKVAVKLRSEGHEVVAASPDTGVDSFSGKGLAEALSGADAVVDVSNSQSFDERAVLDFFEKSTRNLLAAEAAEGVKHHVVLSVVGSDRLSDSGYMRAKVAQETLVEESYIPYTIVHATQFFEFAKAIADSSTEHGLVRVPAALIQPMAADEVASAVARAATGSPWNRVVEVAGPEAMSLADFVRRGLRARGDVRTVVADPHARYFGAKLDDRTLLPDDHATLGTIRFEEWLAPGLHAG